MDAPLAQSGPALLSKCGDVALAGGRNVFAYLNDLYVLCGPTRVQSARARRRSEIWENVLFVWEHLELRAQALDPDAIVWRGNGDLPSNAARFDDTRDVLLATPILSRTNSPSGQTAMTFWWVASLWWRMSRAIGSCWSIVLLHGPTSFLRSVRANLLCRISPR